MPSYRGVSGAAKTPGTGGASAITWVDMMDFPVCTSESPQPFVTSEGERLRIMVTYTPRDPDEVGVINAVRLNIDGSAAYGSYTGFGVNGAVAADGGPTSFQVFQIMGASGDHTIFLEVFDGVNWVTALGDGQITIFHLSESLITPPAIFCG